MTDERSPEAGLWDEDEDHEDDEQTQVARNPLLVGPPTSSAGAPRPTAAAPAETNGEPRRSLSSFGAPKAGKKSSLLERLTEAGTLDEVMAIDEVSRNSQLPKAPEARLGLDRPFADLSEVSSGVPHALLESLVPGAPDREEAPVAPLPVEGPAERRSSVPPVALTELQPTPVARVPTVRRVLEPVREITAVRDPRRDPDDDFAPSRPSSERLSDADLQFVSETRDVSFVSALSQDPDVDEPPVVARFKRPPELPRNQPTVPPVASAPTSVSPPSSLPAAPDSLTPPATPIALGAAALPPPLPSMMVAGTPALARGDTTPTERMPLPRPANHSTAPTSVPKTERPPERRSALPRMLVAAAVLVGVGLAGLSRYRNAESQAEPVAMAAPSAVTPKVEAPLPAPAPADAPPAEPAPAVGESSAAQAAATPSEASSPEEVAAHAARQEERERRRREREEARAAAAAQAPAGEDVPAQAPAGEDVPAAAAPAASAPPLAAEAKPAVAEAKPAPANGALPSQPTRDQVVAAMNAVLPRLQECVGDKHGQANVTITVRAAGFVSYAIVAGTFVGTPEGSCIARVVKEAQFPPFSEPFIRITYPYQL